MVAIDIFRAFSFQYHAIGRGASRLFAVSTLQTAYELKNAFPTALLAGEQEGRVPPCFDLDNSPTAIFAANVRGKTIIHLTSSGTPALVSLGPERTIIGAFVAMSAIADYVKMQPARKVAFLCTESSTAGPTNEDTIFAAALRTQIHGDRRSPAEIKSALLAHPRGQMLLRRDARQCTHDFDLCTDIDYYDFVLGVETAGPGWVIVKPMLHL